MEPGINFPRVCSVGLALPRNRLEQSVVSDALWQAWGATLKDRGRFDRFQRSVQVNSRYLACPIEEYGRTLGSLGRTNARWRQAAIDLGADAVRAGLDGAGLKFSTVDHIFFTTVTGIATPSVDATIANRLGMRLDVKRTPLFGLGCVGGAATIARAADYLRAFPDEIAVVLSVELCSLTLQPDDLSTANVIAAALFGDGAGAVVLSGGHRARAVAGPRIIASQTILFPNTEDLMGWDVSDNGFRIILSAGVPSLIRNHLRQAVDHFLARYELTRRHIRHWIAHTGGPKVLEAMEIALELPSRGLERSWRSLAELGNLSSASVLYVLGDLLNSDDAQQGDWGVLLAMGPGFCAEIVLLHW